MSAIYLGLMSGTSMDGIDAALVDFSQSSRPQLLDYISVPYSQQLLDELHQLNLPVNNELERALIAGRKVGRAFAAAANQLLQQNKLTSDLVVAIGSHGQTIRHQPGGDNGFSLQIGCAHTIACESKIDVVADFRNTDIALGGQGAPLVPAFHQAVFADQKLNRAVVNIGGIANISYLPANNPDGVQGFDTGPGNTLMDAWCLLHTGQPYDKDGKLAAQGKCNQLLLQALMQHPYLAKIAPKSTGRDEFHLDWLQQLLVSYAAISVADVQATLLQFTAHSIAADLVRLDVDEVYICGGGAYNSSLMAALQQQMQTKLVTTTADLGINPDAVEAMAFAWLAFAYDNNLTGNVPAVTGASGNAILGAKYKAPR
ncbi:anhydro-N-acetylmuramic acid kinase [Neptunicella marina]|uniref:Anhydro-N-acetylmuramic acid kinase n=1 Tax=Neptunicella marina TaxID=2125989 RepID=A0A8J6ITA2_9ALTE|nr:anhydro-N-acetylmuramic acid kinase [Neptunicella marina]MBC3765176.1 anhydro-N-acetylmuramic acid kinase [Neptunicella marina]